MIHQVHPAIATPSWYQGLRQWALRLCLSILVCLCAPQGLVQAQTVYFHNDVAGSPIAATDEAGNLLWRESYRPYGERMLKPATANSQWFHGKQTDPSTGVSDFGARNYDPVLGRFLSIDPVDFSEKNLHSFNRYNYGNNNPLKFKDPDGNLPFLIPVVGWLAEVGLATYVRGVAVSALRSVAADVLTGVAAAEVNGAAVVGAAGLAAATRQATVAARGASELANAANYRSLFLQARPDLPIGWQVHHSIPQKYEELMRAAGVNIHDLQFLRGVSGLVHSKITTAWSRFDKAVGGDPSAAQVADFAKQLDRQYDGFFMWPGF